jgi:hypothetical protein
MSGNSAKPLAASAFSIGAGVSNFRHPLKSDHPQFRSVSDVRSMPGYVATSKSASSNLVDAIGHDLAVLTLSRPLDLGGDDVRAAHLPSSSTPVPSHATRLVMAGFGNEKRTAGVAYANGTLNEMVKAAVLNGCSVRDVLCVLSTSDTCWGDSGLGAVEPGPHPILIGILSEDDEICAPGGDYFVSLTAPAILGFIKN